MIRMLLCDDDEVILEGICECIDWQSYDIELIAAVNNGKKAMQILEQESPDLILTDIRMPYYTGLDIAWAAKQKSADIIVVILSGYNDFEYARKAIKMGVLDFISKPIDLDELDHVLRKVTEQWKNQQYSRHRDMRDGFARLINRAGEALPEDVTWMSEMFENRIVCVLILELDEFQLVMYGGSEETRYETIKDYRELSALFHKQGIIVMERSEYSMFLCCYRESASDLELQLGMMRQRVRMFNEAECHITKITLACSKLSEDFQKMNLLKNQAEDALRFKFIKGIGQTIRYDDIEVYACGQGQAVMGELSLPSPMKLAGREEIPEIMEKIRQKFKSAEGNAEFAIRLSAGNWIIRLSQELAEYHIDLTDIFERPTDIYDRISSISDVENMVAYIGQIYTEIYAYVEKKKNGKYIDVISLATKYIRENYKTNTLSISEVAEYVNMSVGYFSLIFHNETGDTFSDYLLKLRMDKACGLLEHTNMKLLEISWAVGYENANYFSTVFEKVMGVTPSAYRHGARSE